MNLAVSNIAWTNEEEPEVAALLEELGVKYIEVAPTKKWENPTKATQAEINAYKQFWQSYGIEIVAFQSMLFTHPELKIFESESNRTETAEYLKDFISLAANMGAGVLVFGSPKNRQHGERDDVSTQSIARNFFAELGEKAKDAKVRFCIEPNAPQYVCDFVTTARQGIEIVEAVNSPGFGLHLDIACMTLAEDNIRDSIMAAAPILEHFHISSPMLDTVEDRADVNHREAADTLRAIGYDKYVSIEMKPAAVGENVERVKNAVLFAQSVYEA